MDIGKLGFGVYRITDEEKVCNAVKTAIEVGYPMIDTATFYKNEEYIGNYLRENKLLDKVLITTKVWIDDMTYDGVFRSFKESLAKLGRVDILLLHWPRPDTFVESYKALEEIYKKGLVSKIGVSNFTIENLETLKKECEIKPFLNQIELHPKFSQKELKEYHEKEGIITEAWAPLGTARYLDDETLQDIARKNSCTASQVILAWHRQNNIYAIPKSETPSRIIENYQSLNVTLTDEDINRIDYLNEDLRFGYDPVTFPYTNFKARK